MTCRYCGSELDDSAKFCKFCGEQVFVTYTEPESKDERDSSRGINWYDFKGFVKIAAAVITGILTLVVFFLGIASKDSADRRQTAPTIGEQTIQEEQQGLPKPNKLELSYCLTQEDVDGFYRCLEDCELLCVSGEDLEKAQGAMDALEASFEVIETQCAVANVLSYADTKDERLTEQVLQATDHLIQANDAYIQMLRRIYLSATPIKEQLFAQWTQQELEMLLSYTQEVADLSNRNAQLQIAYRTLDKESLDEEMIPLYTEMVSNYNQIAKIYGYENFYEYAYRVEYQRDYTPEDVAQMRILAVQYLIPAGQAAMTQLLESVEELSFGDQLRISSFLYEDFDESVYLERYLSSLPQGMGDCMLEMFYGDSYFTADEDAMEGAFTTALGDRMFCFFGPGYGTPMTVVHELGHYYSGNYQQQSEMPLDLMETQSQGNEWLFIRYLENEMSPELYGGVTGYKLYNDIAVVIAALIIDEFEQRVYSVPDISQYTQEDLDEIMDAVCSRYGGTAFVAENFADIMSYWKLVVVESPVYYISYAVSALGAMELYLDTGRSYKEAVEAYALICETPELSFLGALKAAGLAGPFDERTYTALAQLTAVQ